MSSNDIGVGYHLPELPIEQVNPEHIRQIALVLNDPNPIHFDLEAVAAAGLGDREINQGGSTMAYIIGMITAWTGTRSCLRRIQCRFRDNVRAGDSVTAGGIVVEIIGVGPARQAVCEVWVNRQDGRRVIDGTAVVAIPDS